MMGERQVDQGALFYEFSLEEHVPSEHMLRSINRFVDLNEVRQHLAPFYSTTGRPSVDPELMIRMLIVGYCTGIRSERRLCEEVNLSRCAKCCAAFTRRHATSPGVLPRLRHMRNPVAIGRRSRCSSPTSNAFSSSANCACVAQQAPETNSPSQQSLKT